MKALLLLTTTGDSLQLSERVLCLWNLRVVTLIQMPCVQVSWQLWVLCLWLLYRFGPYCCGSSELRNELCLMGTVFNVMVSLGLCDYVAPL